MGIFSFFWAVVATLIALLLAKHIFELPKLSVINSRLAKLDQANIRNDQKLEEISLKRKDIERIESQHSQKLENIKHKGNEYILNVRLEAAKLASEANQSKSTLQLAQKGVASLQYQIEAHQKFLLAKTVEAGSLDQSHIPKVDVLDELASAYGHVNAGSKLKESRMQSRQIAKLAGAAAHFDATSPSMSDRAVKLVVDSFNTKFDAIVSKVRTRSRKELTKELSEARDVINMNASAYAGVHITDEYYASRAGELKWACILNEHRTREQEEQRELRAQIKEEEMARKEHEAAAREADDEERAARKAIADAQVQILEAKTQMESRLKMAIALGEEDRARLLRERDHAFALQADKMAELEARLQTAEAKSHRELSMAQQTRMGYVYIISNLGAFGDDIYKIGMTRRLEPMDRVKELGDASVPFNFDVHALIMSNDAPALERELHKKFAINRVNKINPRKEFFRAKISDIKRELGELGYEATWTLASEASEFMQSQRIDDMGKQNPNFWDDWLKGGVENADYWDEQALEEV